MEIFQGFQQSYPEYEVFLPQTKTILTVRSLNTEEELKLKTSVVGKKNNIDILNRTLFNCLVSKPETITTYEDFLNKITLKDREALFAGVYHCSYGNEMELRLTCNKCQYEYEVKTDLTSGVNINEYPGKQDEVLSKTIDVEMEIAPAIVSIKEPTLKMELDTFNNNMLTQMDDEFTTTYMIVDSIQYTADKNNPEWKKIANEVDKIFALKSLTPRDRKKIKKYYADNFGKYNITFKYETICPSCKNMLPLGVDIIDQFFRKVFE